MSPAERKDLSMAEWKVTIDYDNSAADRWAAWGVAASLDAAVLLAGRPGVARHPQPGLRRGSATGS